MTPRPDEFQAVLIGASTLIGKEVKAVIAEHSLPLRLALVDTGEEQGRLTEFDGEPVLVQPIDAETFENHQAVIFAAPPQVTAEHWRRAEQSGCRIIDLSYFLASEPRAVLRAPLLEPPGEPAGAADRARENADELAVSAHPMAIALAGVLRAVSKHAPVARAVATILEPASERGSAGVDELHRQTVGLLSFQEIPKNVYDAQVSFNLLSHTGAQAATPLGESRARIVDHLARLLGKAAPLPAVSLLQAGVFHGYGFSCWVELARAADVHEIEEALDRRPFVVRRGHEEQPSPVIAATNDEILIGAVQTDAASANGFWIWGALDNLRVAALNAERILLEMMGLPVERAVAPAASGREDRAPDS